MRDTVVRTPFLQFEETQNLDTELQMMGASSSSSSSSSSSLLFQQRSVGMITFMAALLTTNTVVYCYVCTTTTSSRTTHVTQPSFFGRTSSSHHQPQQLHCRLSLSSLSFSTMTSSSLSTAIGLSNPLDDNIPLDNEEAAATTTTTAESPPPMEKTWRYVKKPLLRIGNKGPSKSHGNSLKELLVHAYGCQGQDPQNG